MFRPAVVAVAAFTYNTFVAGRIECLSRPFGEHTIDLYAEDFRADLREHRCLVAASGADLQHHAFLLYAGELGHQGHDERLADCLLPTDRQGAVEVGVFADFLRHEQMARYIAHRLKHEWVGDAPLLELAFDHLPALGLDSLVLRNRFRRP